MLNRLMREMVTYFSGDPKRVQHFMKVHAFAKWIGEEEGMDPDSLFVLEAAAYVHDIGIKKAEEKFGSCGGKLQEQEGPPEAQAMLERLGFAKEVTARVSYLVGHHHTYTDITDLDYQILVEADFLVNLYEDGLSESAVTSARNKIFRTKSGQFLCNAIFGLDKIK